MAAAPLFALGCYFGQTTRQLALEGLSVSLTTYPAGLVAEPHEHVNPFFCLVLDGEGLRSWRGAGGAEQPMTLTLFPAGHEHANRWLTAGRVLHLEFAPDWLTRLRGQSVLLKRALDVRQGLPIALARRLAAECAQAPDPATALAIEGLSLELLAAIARQSPRREGSRPAWLKRAEDLLAARFRDPPLLADLAATCGVGADHLLRSFRRWHGATLGAYVRRLRIEHACRLLARQPALTLGECALACGFYDQSHFTRVFRQQVGDTPGRYREALGR